MTRRALSERALIGLLAAATAMGALAVNIYLPVLPLVRGEFAVSVAAASVTVTAPLIAFAVGLFAWGPWSDHHGRRPTLLLGLGINIVGSCLALASPSLGWLTLARVIQAAGSSAGVTVARATIGDLFERERLARMMAYLTMVMVVANSLAPAAGGALADRAGWRSVFVALCILSTLVFIAGALFMPETRSREHPRGMREMLAAARTLITTPAFVVFALLSGAIYAEFFVFVSLMPYVFGQALGHSPGEYGLWYLAIGLGYFAGNWCVTRFAHALGVHRLLASGVAISALAAVAGWAIARAGLWQPVWLFAPFAVVAFGQGLGLPTLTASAVALAPRSAGIVAGLLGFIQQFAGAVSVQLMALGSVATPVPITLFSACVAVGAWLAFGLSGRAFRATTAPRAS